MEIAICADTENTALLLKRLKSYTVDRKTPVVEAFDRREALLYRMKDQHFDVVMVALPGAMGMETAMSARQFDESAALIWASDEAAFIAESYRLRVTMFLSLPLVEEQVDEMLHRVGLRPSAAHHY